MKDLRDSLQCSLETKAHEGMRRSWQGEKLGIAQRTSIKKRESLYEEQILRISLCTPLHKFSCIKSSKKSLSLQLVKRWPDFSFQAFPQIAPTFSSRDKRIFPHHIPRFIIRTRVETYPDDYSPRHYGTHGISNDHKKQSTLHWKSHVMQSAKNLDLRRMMIN